MPSFDSVNYSIRPNKSVERKIVFSSLRKLSGIIPLSAYRYVGLGSLWFVDFLMAHKLLGISSMVSIEKSTYGIERAEFNRPLSCIDVEAGETTAVIPTLKFEKISSIVWLDYETSIDGPVLKDIEMLGSKCSPNSIVLVTINARSDTLPDLDENDKKIDREESLRKIAGDLVPTTLSVNQFQSKHYPKLLIEILSNHFQSTVKKSGRSETFIKLFDLVYTDGTPMVTIGGIFATAGKVDEIKQLVEAKIWEGIAEEFIAIPPLTLKEKMALDSRLPSELPLTEEETHEMGFKLKQAQINAYHRYYLHYPMYGEFLF